MELVALGPGNPGLTGAWSLSCDESHEGKALTGRRLPEWLALERVFGVVSRQAAELLADLADDSGVAPIGYPLSDFDLRHWRLLCDGCPSR